MARENDLSGEVRAFGEYWELIFSPVYRGDGVPRGNGTTVLLLPGLFGNDLYLRPLYDWLTRTGYRPVLSSLSFNAGCPKRLLAQVEESFAAVLSDEDRGVAIIGHSRGGLLGKAMCTRLGESCSCLITLGSPLGAILRTGKSGLQAMSGLGQSSTIESIAANPVAQAGRAALRLLDPDCNLPNCDCDYVNDLLAPFPSKTNITCVLSTEDSVVSPSACAIEGVKNIEVTGSHTGLVYNRLVYPHIAEALKDATA